MFSFMGLSCDWDGAPNGCDNFTEPQPTDAGYCYTYNGQQNNVRSTRKTGDYGFVFWKECMQYESI